MDRHADRIEARRELSEASKGVHHWDAMSRHLRNRLGSGQYREKRASARLRFERADKRCRDAEVANRLAVRSSARV